jgi:hypothetical protein
MKFNMILTQNDVNNTNERWLVMHARSRLQKRRQRMQVLHHVHSLAHALCTKKARTENKDCGVETRKAESKG